jgi:hypothetical protein
MEFVDVTMDAPSLEGAGLQLALRVAPNEIDQCWNELASAGVQILDPPEDHGSGHRTLSSRDPERNVLEICADIEPRDDARSQPEGE